MSEAKFSALIRKNGRIQWMPVPGCINSQEARVQAEQMYAGKVVQIRFDGRTKDFPGNSYNSQYDSDYESDPDGNSFFGLLALLGLGIVITIIANFWQYILVGIGLAIFAYIMHLKKS